MLKCPLVAMMAAGLVLLPISSAFSAAFNPTPTRESKLLVDFESDTMVTSDPYGAGENRATINTDSQSRWLSVVCASNATGCSN